MLVNYNSGLAALTAAELQTAPVTIPSHLAVSTSIDCIYNATGTACNAYDGSGIIPVNAKVRYMLTNGRLLRWPFFQVLLKIRRRFTSGCRKNDVR